MKISFAAFLAALLLLLPACHSRRGAVVPEGSTSSPAAAPMPQMRLAELLASYPAWKDVKIPVSLNLQSPTAVSLGGTLTMQRDKSALLQLRFLGLEVASAYVTTDSVYFYYKIGKVYMAESTKRLLGNFPVTVGNVQNLLLGRIFKAGAAAVNARDCDPVSSGSGGYTVAMPRMGSVDYAFDVSAANALTALVVTPAGYDVVTCRYGQPSAGVNGPVASDLGVKARIGRTNVEATLELSANKAQWNQGNAPRFKVPNGYRRVKAAELLNSFKF